ncbi:response regulator transcription factor [Paraglaciecola chathamensis]|jgi:DNA-binding response OmpR family regulator|uniref:Uncharacterized protein n=1 Tax=Paraglaciecola chathamensis S18K6 TaxID=1127672 RepID=A0AAV3V444_9ALTE|nr:MULTISPECIES: response regulator [Paraglaciecola]MBN25122.1 response regulator [Alteromonadaceae bacterium]MBU3018877.1 response regulator [Paraglaciecola agarilytica]GAC11487.1 hypothetical protein GCHA_3557 [Paraglaciecola chathamensis S18K6]|tara:strand:+ start:37517 stop:38308 length:792 start_codon:yes stop_codon:yes gene_type:complete
MLIDHYFAELDTLTENTRKVMIIDDDSSMTDYLEELCLDLKVEPFVYHEALVALDNISLVNPSLIIVDWLMQPMNGLNFMRAVRRKHSKTVFMLFLTGSAQNDTHKKALQHGATVFLEKAERYSDILEEQIKTLLSASPSMTQSEQAHLSALAMNDKELAVLLDFHQAAQKRIKSGDKLKDIYALMTQPKSKLYPLLNKYFQLSSQEYIISYRLYLASKLLRQLPSTQDVSDALGYSNSANFSNAFKAKYTAPPLKFIKTLSK